MGQRLPSLFVSHGAPTLPLDTAHPTHRFLKELGTRLGRPRAILVISAHWDTPGIRLTGAARPETIHDFYGFPEALYALRYPAPGAPDLAAEIASRLKGAELDAAIDPQRGLDHGAWVPLLLMYPAADIPVLQLSLQTRLGTTHHLRLGDALAPLREQDVLILGSGGATHNLREFFRPTPGTDLTYASAFTAWLERTLTSGDRDALLHYRERAPHAVRAHPTEEHFLPLLAAFGAGGSRAERLHAAMDGSLAMDAYSFAD